MPIHQKVRNKKGRTQMSKKIKKRMLREKKNPSLKTERLSEYKKRLEKKQTRLTPKEQKAGVARVRKYCDIKGSLQEK